MVDKIQREWQGSRLYIGLGSQELFTCSGGKLTEGMGFYIIRLYTESLIVCFYMFISLLYYFTHVKRCKQSTLVVTHYSNLRVALAQLNDTRTPGHPKLAGASMKRD